MSSTPMFLRSAKEAGSKSPESARSSSTESSYATTDTAEHMTLRSASKSAESKTSKAAESSSGSTDTAKSMTLRRAKKGASPTSPKATGGTTVATKTAKRTKVISVSKKKGVAKTTNDADAGKGKRKRASDAEGESSSGKAWTHEETQRLVASRDNGDSWKDTVNLLPGRTRSAAQGHYKRVQTVDSPYYKQLRGGNPAPHPEDALKSKKKKVAEIIAEAGPSKTSTHRATARGNPNWTREQDDVLLTLWFEMKNAEEIAEVLGDKSAAMVTYRRTVLSGESQAEKSTADPLYVMHLRKSMRQPSQDRRHTTA